MTPDWSTWSPTERAALCFIVSGGRILLIHKKRGLGAGKVNGPGGRLEPDETPLSAAIRETREEVGVTPTGLREAGALSFQFCDGYALFCTVFRADGMTGELCETDEALPFWSPLAEIPYAQMWADDALWLPLLVKEIPFRGRFVFDGEKMLFHEVKLRETSTCTIPTPAPRHAGF
ncbi:MAG: 8-oxo-dGTP diphosphatase [Verrucomicrobiales bacterium]|jgi:8-oxo-dGTP diphosphatase|nr:8-oxo-dGTP diphosphatase [Verrucomicrobiales bacterium]